MTYYVGLDVSLKQAVVCIIDEAGHVVGERTVASHPDDIGKCLATFTETIGRVGGDRSARTLALWRSGGMRASIASSAPDEGLR